MRRALTRWQGRLSRSDAYAATLEQLLEFDRRPAFRLALARLSETAGGLNAVN
jgi:hypothetical protein